MLLVAGRLLAAPQLPFVIRTFGTRRTFLTVKILSLVLWVLLGLLLARNIVGAAVGATLVLTLGPAWGIMARGAFEIPLIIVLLCFRPAKEPAAPEASPEGQRHPLGRVLLRIRLPLPLSTICLPVLGMSMPKRATPM